MAEHNTNWRVNVKIYNSTVQIYGDKNAPYFSIYTTKHDRLHPGHCRKSLTLQELTEWLSTQSPRSLVAYARKTNKTRAVFVLKKKDYVYTVTDKHTGELYAIIGNTKITIFNNLHKRSVTRFIKHCMQYGYLEV